MARSFTEEGMSDSHKIVEARYRMSHIIPSGTIARTFLLAGILLAVLYLATQSFFPAFAQTETDADPTEGTEQIDYDENGDDPVVVYAATDPEGGNVTWSIVEDTGTSPDFGDFDRTNGVLTFKDPPDFENPMSSTVGDAATENTYIVQVRASTSDGPHHTITVTVNVQNVNEPGEVTFSHPQPKEGTAISVTLTDDDGPVAGQDATLTDNASTTWQWYRSESKDGPWGTPIATSTDNPTLSNTRTPEAADVGHYLRATATYFDGQDTDEERTAHGISANKVVMEEYINAAPVFPDDDEETTGSQITMSVPEDESLEEGDAVGQPVTATDIGEDGSQEVLTYTRDATAGSGASFTIDSESGQLKLAAETTLDAETTTTYTVTVTASDPDGLSADVTVTINITGVDEAPTISGDDEPEQDENTLITTAVATFTGADDEDDDATLTWSLTGTNRNVFDIDETGATAELTFKSMQNYEALSSSIRSNGYRVTVNVTDSNGNTGSMPVTVRVTNEEEDGTVTLSHPEARVGTSITATLSDDDKPTGVTWTWSQGGTVINGATGSSHRPTTETGDLTATATYRDGFSATTKTVTSSAYPVVPAVSAGGNTTPAISDPGNPTVSETALIGTTVVTFSATDDDTDSTFLFNLTSGSNWFELDRLTGVLTTKVALNHEQRDSYPVTVSATDSSRRTSAGRRVTISVTNAEEDPVIAEGGASLDYPEIKSGRPNTDAVFTYTATDDEDNNANLGWTLSSSDVFELSNATGANTTLRFQSAPDYEDGTFTNPAIVTITVTDSNTGTARREVTVNVTNIDEPGMVTGLPAQPKEGVQMTVMLVDDPDGPVTGQDDTLTDNASTTWEWYRSRSRTSGWVLISATSTTNMDVNTNTRTPEAADVGYYLRATAKYSDGQSPDDGQGPDKVAHGMTTRTIQAKEYVNSAPVFRDDDGETAGYQITMEVNEDDSLDAGDPVGDPVTATDIGSAGTQETLIYTLDVPTDDEGDDQESFTIDRLSGQLKLFGTATLDYEDTSITDSDYEVRVKAIDPAMASSTALVTIQIIPVDEDPEFGDEDKTVSPAANLAATSTVENTATTTALSAYTATDDEDDNRDTPLTRTWSLEGADEDKFALCDENGSGDTSCTDLTAPNAADATDNTVTLRFKEEPNFESPSDSGGNNVYNVTVVATDSDNGMSEHEVTVTVTDMDEPGTVTLSHIQPEVGTRITASLTDPDGASGTTWEWFWCATDDATCSSGTTKINTTSATYTPIQEDAGSADTEDDGRYLVAKATYTDRTSSGAQDKRMASATSTNKVQDDDATNQPPVLPDVTQTLEIPENSEDTDPVAVVGTVVATSDPDDELDSLLYTLSGADEALFTIHSGPDDSGTTQTEAAGQIRLKSGTELDYETKNTYRVTVTATDPSLARDTVAVIIEVTNVNEPPTVSQRGLTVTGPASVSYAEDRTDAVETYRAVGPDASGASWSLSGTDAGAFSIPGGVLSFDSQPDYEAAADAGTDNMYNVTVMASMGSFSDSQDVTVNVTNVDEDGTASISPATQPRVGVELTASVTDDDGTPTAVSWQWSRSTSNTGGWSNIQGATNAAYTPVEDDVDNYLRASASYTDPQGPGKSESATTTDTVLAESTAGIDGTVSLSASGSLVSGDTVTATLTDPDTPTGLTWVWQASANGSTNWSAGAGSDSSTGLTSTYTTTNADGGEYLRATVTYADDSGAGQTAESPATTGRVAIDSYDRNSDGRIDAPEVLAAVADYFGGTIDGSRVLDVVALYFSGLN